MYLVTVWTVVVFMFLHHGRNALVGMLMIPKTCAYLAVACIAYNALSTGKHRKKKAKQV